MTVQDFSVFVLSSELLLACLVAIIASIICIEVFKQQNRPPCLGFWQPWIGCALEFGKEPLYFIESARRKVSYFILCTIIIHLAALNN